jgi:hypothetical protein
LQTSDSSIAQAKFDLSSAKQKIIELENEQRLWNKTEQIIEKEKSILSQELQMMKQKYEEVHREYLQAVKDSTNVPQPSMERHEELKQLLTQITQEKDQLQRNLLKATDQALIMQTRLTDAHLVAENAKE